MVRAFSEQEKELIRQALMDKGKELFGIFGLRKTSIAELTRAADISQGSFYLFFESKEELYFEILEQEEEAIQRKLLALTEQEPFSSALLKRFLIYAQELIKDSPLVHQVFTGDEHERLLRKLPPERIEKHLAKDTNLLLPLIQQWQKNGSIITKEPEVIVGVLRSYFLLMLHKKEIGEAIFPETIELLAEMIAEGLINNE